MSVDQLRASACSPPLVAKLAPWSQRFLDNKELISSLIKSYGSPVHVVVKSEFHRNVQDLLFPIKQRHLPGGLYFARKANKLPWFVEAARDAEIGVDTASFQELEETIALRLPPTSIVVTAIGKEKPLIELAVSQGCVVVVDNYDELSCVKAVAETMKKAARIGIRLAGFKLDGKKLASRFGFPTDDFQAVLQALESSSYVRLEVLHAHLDKYEIRHRVCAAMELLSFTDLARQAGHPVAAIDLGGGIVMRYLEEEQQWKDFQLRLVEAVLNPELCFTYDYDGFGLQELNNKVSGEPNLYPAWNSISKERFIERILDDTTFGVALHRQINDRGLRVYFEPGRALLDNTAISLSAVRFRKRDTNGNLLIGLAMNRLNLRPFRAEFCSDPLIVTLGARKPLDEGAFLVGNLCSESDFIFRRRLDINILPEPDDIFCFINTAGYLAHHMEIGTHGGPLPKNVLLNESTFEVDDVI